MARITRQTQVIFGSAGLVGTAGFGGAASGNPATQLANTLAISTIMATSYYTNGWLAATLGATKFPAVEDMNAVEFVNTTQLAYLYQQGLPEYDAGTTYYTNNICMKAGTFQLYGSLTNNNIGNALSDPTNWQLLADFSTASGFTTGDMKDTWKTTADTGWIMMNDGSIGSATSGATTRANADTLNLYTLFWNNISNTYAPVAGGRGASAAADFAANKALTLPAMKGRAKAVSGTGSGLTARALGQTIGEEAHALTSNENGTHNHTVNITDGGHTHGLWSNVNGLNASFIGNLGSAGIYTIAGGLNAAGTQYYYTAPGDGHAYMETVTTGITATTVNSGSGTAHNTMQPTTFMNVMVKL